MTTARVERRMFGDAEMLEAVRSRRFDSGVAVPTFREFDAAVRRRWAREGGGTMMQTYQWASDDALRPDYALYVAGRFERGAVVPGRVWRAMDEASRSRILATRRAQFGALRLGGRPLLAPAPPLTRQGDPDYGFYESRLAFTP